MKKKNLQFIFILALLLVTTPINAYGMHIMEGFLPKGWAIFWIIVCVPFVILGVKRIKTICSKNPSEKILIAMCGAFVFVLSAMKIPSITGSCSHPTGVGLGAILFGPSIMTVLGLIVLLFQAILLAHGGISTLGANLFSMAIAGPFAAYFVYKLCLKFSSNKKLAVFMAAAVGDLFTYVVTSIQLGVVHYDPSIGMSAAVVKFLGVFALTQIPLAVGEGLLTTIIYNMIVENFQDAKDGVLVEE